MTVRDGHGGPATGLVLSIAAGTLREVTEVARALAPMVVVPERSPDLRHRHPPESPAAPLRQT